MGCCGCSDDEHGQKKSFDPNFKGPIKNRSCTDIICCLLFFIFVIGFIVIGVFAWLNGDPIILLHPTDNSGRICGVNYVDLDLSNNTNLYFFDFTQCANPATTITFQCRTTQICVPSCPDYYWSYFPDVSRTTNLLTLNNNREIASAAVDWTRYICKYGFNPQTEFLGGMDIQTMISAGFCAPYVLPLTPIANRCIPEINVDLTTISVPNSSITLVDANNVTITGSSLDAGLTVLRAYLNAREIAEQIFSDLTASWYWLLVAFVIAAIVAFFWILLMRWIAGIVIWTILLTLVGLLGFGIWYCYDEWNRLRTIPGSDRSVLSVGFTTNLETYLALQDTWLAFMIILAVLEVILILLIIFLRKRIQIAIQVIKEASKAVSHMISTLFFPLVTFLLVLITLIFWLATELFLASSGDPEYIVIDNRTLPAGEVNMNGELCNITEWSNESHPFYLNDSVKCVFDKYGGNSTFHQNIVWLQVVSLFMMLWIVNWILALGMVTLSGAFASYYWTWKKPRDIPLTPVFTSFGRALRYHTGSMAFGALLIAIVQMIRIFLEYIDSKVKGSENRIAKVILCCCKCCFWCLEKILKFINRNAYIMIAIYGKNFCWSAKEALSLLLRNILRAFVLDKVTDFIIFIGKLFVGVGMGVLSWAFFTNKISSFSILTAPSLNYYWLLVVIVAVGSYLIASGFFNTYSTAVDTIFLCFLEDLERNDGSQEKPYYMSKDLMKILGKKNKKPKKKTK